MLAARSRSTISPLDANFRTGNKSLRLRVIQCVAQLGAPTPILRELRTHMTALGAGVWLRPSPARPTVPERQSIRAQKAK